MHARLWLCDYHTLGQVRRGAAWEKTHPPPAWPWVPHPSFITEGGGHGCREEAHTHLYIVP